MKVNIEVQSLSDRNFRGIPYYVKNLLEELVKRDVYEYSGTFFDFQRQRCNCRVIESHIDNCVLSKIRMYENNNKDYRKFRENALFDRRFEFENYSDFFDMKADVYHFPHSNSFGYNLPKNSIVTVNDIIPIVYRGMGVCSKEQEDRFINSQNYLKEREDVQIIAISKSTKKDLCEYLSIDKNRIHVVYDAYDSKLCFPEVNKNVLLKFKIDKPYILYVGALDLRKGIDDILGAYEYISKKYKDIALVIAGKAELSFVEKMKNCHINTNIIFTGYVTDDEKRALYSSAEMFLFPSKYEGFGIPILESMACGCPVITTNVSSIPEVGENAVIYVEPGNVEMLIDKIENLLDDFGKRELYKDAGLQQVKKFSWKRTAIETEKIYSSII